jgi:hypothetical protein
LAFGIFLARGLASFEDGGLLSVKLARSASMISMTLPLVRDATFAIGWPLFFF